MKTILAPIDFSPVTRAVVQEAVALATAVEGQVVLLHAAAPPALVSDLAPLVGEALKFTAEVERSARRKLRALQVRCAKLGAIVDTVCEQGFPLPLALAQADRFQADYIVIGSHGHSPIYDLVVGSTARGVLKRAPCPVVVVPAIRKENRARKRPARVRAAALAT